VAEAWLTKEEYAYEATFVLEDFRGAVYLGAVDLSETTDLTCAKVLLMKPGDETKYIHTRYFIPEGKLEKSPDESAGADYRKWAQDGWLEVMPGSDIDLAKVADWFLQLYDQHDMRPLKVGYDQRFAKQFLNRMEEYGIECEMVYQNPDTMSNAVKLVEADLIGQRLNYQNNPIDRWCLSNASIKVNNQGQALIVKPQGRAAYRIDGATCFAILQEIYRRYRSEFTQAIT